MFDHCLYFNTAALARRLEREWGAAFARFELTPPQAFALRVVLNRPGILQRQLAEDLRISRPTATRALDGLALRRLIERRSVASDGREVEIHPTDAAIAIKKDINDASAAVTTRLKRLLSAEGFASAVASIKGVRTALK